MIPQYRRALPRG